MSQDPGRNERADAEASDGQAQAEPCLTIVIPTYQAPNLQALLAALAAQARVEQIAEILVVGQQVDAAALECWPKVRFIEVEHRPTPARNRNLGAAAAQTGWICFLDADALPCQYWLDWMLAHMKTGAPVLAGAVQIPEDAGYWARCDNLISFQNQLAPPLRPPGHHHMRERSDRRILKSAASINLAIRRSLFLDMGGFDESFPFAAGEDRDISWRLEQRGIEITFVPEAVVEHRHDRLDRKAACRHLYRYGLATTQFRRKHDDQVRWRLAARFACTPLAGDAAALVRVLVRAVLRPIRQPAYLTRHWRAMPGVAVLDWWHSQGMLQALKERDV